MCGWQDLAKPNAINPSQSFLEACRSLNSSHLNGQVAGLSESTGETTRSTKLPSIKVLCWLTSFTCTLMIWPMLKEQKLSLSVVAFVKKGSTGAPLDF